MKKKLQAQQKTLEEALLGFRHNMTSALVEEAKNHGWSLTHFEVIKYIAEQGNPSLKDIALQLHMTPPSASALIDTLVAKHLVTRLQNPDDRRAIRVTLAPTAQRLLTAIYKKKGSIFTAMLSKLDPKDTEELARILTKCITN